MEDRPTPIRFAAVVPGTAIAIAVAAALLVGCEMPPLDDRADSSFAVPFTCRLPGDGLTDLQSATDAEIETRLTAIWQRLAQHGGACEADVVRALVRELSRRKPQEPYLNGMEYGALMLAGRIDEAETVAAQDRALGHERRIPRAPLAARPAVGTAIYWRYDLAAGQLQEQAVDLRRGTHVVVYSAPDCGFSVAAVREIRADPAWNRFFVAHAYWLHLPDDSYARSLYARWSRAMGDMAIGVLLDRRHWPVLGVPGVPYFVVIHDGEVRLAFAGWPRGSLARIAAALAEAGATGVPAPP